MGRGIEELGLRIWGRREGEELKMKIGSLFMNVK